MRYDIQEARLNEITGTPELLSSDKLKVGRFVLCVSLDSPRRVDVRHPCFCCA